MSSTDNDPVDPWRLSEQDIRRLEASLSQAGIQVGSVDNMLDATTSQSIRGMDGLSQVSAIDTDALPLIADYLFEQAQSQDAAVTRLEATHVTADLGKGDKGIGVAAAQRMFKDLGYPVGPVDGWFGGKTEATVRAFQEDSGLDVTGQLDAATRTQLNTIVRERAAAEAQLRDYNLTGIEQGSTRDLQRALNALGHNAGPEDNKMGPKTRAGMREFIAAEKDAPPRPGQLSVDDSGSVLAAARLELQHRVQQAREQDDIKAMQTALKGLGLYSGAPSGEQDGPTQKALEQFDQNPNEPPFDVASLPSGKKIWAGWREAGDYNYRPIGYNQDLDALERRYGGKVIEGEGSWYGDRFHGKQTASGPIYNKEMPMVAVPYAHRDLYGTVLKVTVNGQTMRAVALDNGPFGEIYDRVLDMSEGMAKQLGFKSEGTPDVAWELDIEATKAWRDHNNLPYRYSEPVEMALPAPKPEQARAVESADTEHTPPLPQQAPDKPRGITL